MGEMDKNNINRILRALPSVDSLAMEDWFEALAEKHSRGILVKATREALDKIRRDVLAGAVLEVPSIEEIRGMVEHGTEGITGGKFKKVINGTGVVLHTNLGRAPLCQEALDRIREVAEGYSNLEFNLESGERGSRHAIVEGLLCQLTGAEGAMVVNNNAAAVTLILSELAKDREVVVSRGQLVEIGGSFRIPDVMAESGAVMREVGTTNKTHLRDYAAAIGENTAALMKIHTSNYRICGFTQEVDQKLLVELAKERGLLAIEDLGSGSLIDLSQHGLPYEPTVQEAIEAGMDLVSFSGDKLLGGPQAGIIAGKKSLIERVKKHPLARAFRMDKLTLAALEGTLIQYIDPEKARKTIPTLHMLTISQAELVEKAEALMKELSGLEMEELHFEIGDDFSEVGGGSLPTHTMKTAIITIESKRYSPDKIAEKLRKGDPVLVGRIARDRFILDVRTIDRGEFPAVLKAMARLS